MNTDRNSSQNQKIKGAFVAREILAPATQLVECILNNADNITDPPFTFDDIENFYSYNVDYKYHGETINFEGSDNEKELLIDSLRDEIENSEISLSNEEISETTHEQNETSLNEAIETIENAESEAQEIFEWWAVTNWLMEKLKEKGQPVIDAYPCLWGRTTTGQAILLDGVISDICADLEILEGQKNEWTNV